MNNFALKNYFKKFFIVLIVSVFSISNFSFAAPMPPEQKALFDNGVMYFDHAIADVCTPVGGTAGTTERGFIGSTNDERIWYWLKGEGLSDVQVAGIMGNFAVESGYSPTRQETGKTWPTGGWGLAQWTATRRIALRDSLTDELTPYYNDDYGGYLESALGGQHPDISEEINLKLLEHELNFMVQESKTRTVSTNVALLGYGEKGANEWETLKQQTTLQDAVVFWHNNYEVSSQSPEQVLLTRIDPAKAALENFGSSGQGTNVTFASNGCAIITGATGTAGAIISKVKEFAWPRSTVGESYNNQATQAYQDAVAQFFPGQSYGDQTLADCTYYVATTMRASGADPNFPLGTTAIREYLLNNQDKYEIIYNPKASDLRPGDILQHTKSGCSSYGCWSGHIMFYTGDLDGTNTWFASDASKYTRVPGYLQMNSVTTMLNESSTILARLKVNEQQLPV